MSIKKQQSIFFSLLIGIFIFIGVISTHYNTFWDITKTKKNTLSKTSIEWVKQLEHPLEITAFTRGNPQLKKLITRIIKQYQKHTNIVLSFKNPDLSPYLTRLYKINNEGEMLLNYQKKTVVSRGITEEFITKAISQLINNKKMSIGWLTLNSQQYIKTDNYSYSNAYKLLSKFSDIILINPTKINKLPSNLDLLIITEKNIDTAPYFAQLINHQIINNNNLLWFVSSTTKQDQLLEKTFGLTPSHQILLSQKAKPYGFKSHKVWSGFVQSHSFKQADTPIITSNIMPIQQFSSLNKNWQYETLLQEPETVFLKQENNIINSNKALSLGWLLRKNQQQAVLVGSSFIIDNTFIHHGSNHNFLSYLVRLLTKQKNQPLTINHQVPSPILLNNEERYSINFLLLLFFPFLIFLFGFVWLSIRKKQIHNLTQAFYVYKKNKNE